MVVICRTTSDVDTGDVVDLNDSFEVKFDAVKRIV
jgi:hypothetical protein